MPDTEYFKKKRTNIETQYKQPEHKDSTESFNISRSNFRKSKFFEKKNVYKLDNIENTKFSYENSNLELDKIIKNKMRRKMSDVPHETKNIINI